MIATHMHQVETEEQEELNRRSTASSVASSYQKLNELR